MDDAQESLTQTEIVSFVTALPFVREYAMQIISVVPGQVVIELPFDERFSGPPGQFPASLVGTAGDVAAVSSCLSRLPRGWALATLDFTIKMTGLAKGEKLRAKGRVLQAGAHQFGGGCRHLCRRGRSGNALRNSAGDNAQFSDQVIATICPRGTAEQASG